jgi:integrase/recombinase XerC
MIGTGRINSPNTERSYRDTLYRHADDSAHGPRHSDRDDVKRTLRRWANPNSQRINRSILSSFYTWMMEEGYRTDNPALQTRRPKTRAANVYRLTRSETQRMFAATVTTRERWAITLGLCAGLRNAELRGLQGRHFRRAGFVWVSDDIGKGGKERWVPIICDLAPVVAEIVAAVAPDGYVLPAQRWRGNGECFHERMDLTRRPSSSQALRSLVIRVAREAGIAAHIHPHVLRHAFADHIAREGGERTAQQMLGHASIATTEAYLSKSPQLDRLAAAVSGITYGEPR